VLKGLILTAALSVLGASSAAQQNPGASEASALRPDAIIAKVICASKPEQSYALYLPSRYSPAKKWPIVYAFDPAARGTYPLEQMKEAADRHGYIVVGSNNSRNGSWKLESEAAIAMFDDTHARLAIDARRQYFAGFSGGARVASALAQRCKCSAGVLLNGAGFSSAMPPAGDAVFPVFAAVGLFDFNYGEVSQLQEQLDEQHFPHSFRGFDGSHEWAPPAVMEEAFAWFRVIAIKEHLEPADDSFIAAQAAQCVERARKFEESGDLYAAWREYHQAADTFAAFPAGASLRKSAASLAPEKAVREGLKRERQEIAEQSQLTREISAGMASLRENADTRVDTRNDLERQIIALRDRCAREKRPEKQRVLRRALGGVLVEAMENGAQPLDTGNFALARDYFLLATAADPDAVWALGNLAATQARTGDRKGALESLRHAREKTKDPAAFSNWLSIEEAFAKLRQESQFRALLR
jgi:predicted esterase